MQWQHRGLPAGDVLHRPASAAAPQQAYVPWAGRGASAPALTGGPPVSNSGRPQSGGQSGPGPSPSAGWAGASAPAASAAAPSSSVGSSVPQVELDPLQETGRYRKIRDLSRGGFGFVQLAENLSTQELVAVKFMERGTMPVSRDVMMEILNHHKLRHPHVVEFKEVFLTSKYICIAMEYASAGSLFTYVKAARRLQEAAARWFFQQLIIGLDYCHRKGVVNRDIKLENVLLEMQDGRLLLKICDFGYSKAHFMSAPNSRVGTLPYMAPEVILCQRGNTYDGHASDIWSCGVMLYVMLFGQYPFEPPKDQETGGRHLDVQRIHLITHGVWSIPKDANVSPACKDFFARLLNPDPTQRITMQGIMTHPWFTTNLPSNATHMNDDFINNEDLNGVQPLEEVHRVLASVSLGREQSQHRS